MNSGEDEVVDECAEEGVVCFVRGLHGEPPAVFGAVLVRELEDIEDNVVLVPGGDDTWVQGEGFAERGGAAAADAREDEERRILVGVGSVHGITIGRSLVGRKIEALAGRGVDISLCLPNPLSPGEHGGVAATGRRPRLNTPPQFPNKKPPEKTKHPRRVRSGIKVPSTAKAAESWAGQRWLRLIEAGTSQEAQVEGLEYAKLGQTRSMKTEPGKVSALVQGRLPRAYRVSIELDSFDRKSWDRIIQEMAGQSRYSAKLLSGELPTTIEELFAPLGLHLFPVGPEDLKATCNCDEPREEGSSWCKHSACAAMIVADRLAEDPWTIFTLRGIERDDLVEQLRHLRLLPGSGDGSAPVYSPHIESIETIPVKPLTECLDHFWDPGSGLEHLHLTPEKPQVTHPLLRRLGQSPFEGSRFPLVGLLATCYDVVSEQVLEDEARSAEDADEDVPEGVSEED